MSESIRFNAAACLLAKAIYYGRAQAFLVDVPIWESLDHSSRELWVNQAQQILNANRPPSGSPLLDSFAGLTRAHVAKVVGRISESEPWGVTPEGNRQEL